MDAQRLSFDVPVNHDAAAAVADVPLGREILVPSPEMLRIRRAGRCSVAPDGGIAGVQRAIGDDGDGLAQSFDANITAPHKSLRIVTPRCVAGRHWSQVREDNKGGAAAAALDPSTHRPSDFLALR